MICLPGIFSQGGEKFTWGRYNTAYGPKAGTAATVSRTADNTIYAADAYTISGSSFKLTSPTRTQFQKLAVGKKTVNINDSGSSSTSGSTLYDITSKGSVTWAQSEGSYGSQTTMRYNADKYGGEFSFVTSIKFDAQKGTFSSGTINTSNVGSGDVIYTDAMSGDEMECDSFSGVSQVRKIQVLGYGSLDGDYLVMPVKIATVSAKGSVNIGYTPYTLQYVRGDFIDDVTSANPEAYPDNGRQGDYWYVRYSDTPITWERYAMTEGEVQGESVTQTATSTTYFYRATSYSRSGKTFTATGTRTRASSLAVGNYMIQNNGAFVNSTSMSGDTLFKITKKSGSSTVSLTFDTYTVGDVKGSYIDTVTSYNPVEYPDDGAQDGYWYVKV